MTASGIKSPPSASAGHSVLVDGVRRFENAFGCYGILLQYDQCHGGEGKGIEAGDVFMFELAGNAVSIQFGFGQCRHGRGRERFQYDGYFFIRHVARYAASMERPDCGMA